LGALAGGAIFALAPKAQKVPASVLPTYAPNIANGRTMFFAGGCRSCHETPDQPDRANAATEEPDQAGLGGGVELASPYGSFYTPNISPHPRDGIGAWSEADFVSAMLKGSSPAGRHYYPAFPYTSYQRMKLEDVRDLFAFLKALPPVEGKARGQSLFFSLGRPVLGYWKTFYLDGKPYVPDPAQSDQEKRGAYLANGPGHCAECHSPRDFFGGIVDKQRFAGGPSPDGEGFVPNITQVALSSYSIRDIEKLLNTGATPDGDIVGGGMARVVKNTRELDPEDVAAIAAYIKSRPAVEGPKPPERH